MQRVNSVGKICGTDELPSMLRAMLPLTMDELEETEDVAPESRATLQQAAVGESRECTWIAGARVLKRLDVEATERGGKGGFIAT